MLYKRLKVDYDNIVELRLEVNRYIVMHVIDYTVITDLSKYESLMEDLERKYGSKENMEVKKILRNPDQKLNLSPNCGSAPLPYLSEGEYWHGVL